MRIARLCRCCLVPPLVSLPVSPLLVCLCDGRGAALSPYVSHCLAGKRLHEVARVRLLLRPAGLGRSPSQLRRKSEGPGRHLTDQRTHEVAVPVAHRGWSGLESAFDSAAVSLSVRRTRTTGEDPCVGGLCGRARLQVMKLQHVTCPATMQVQRES